MTTSLWTLADYLCGIFPRASTGSSWTRTCFRGALRLVSDTGGRAGGRELRFQSTETGSHENREVSTPPLNIKDNTKQDPRFLDSNKREMLLQNRQASVWLKRTFQRSLCTEPSGKGDRARGEEPRAVPTEPGFQVSLSQGGQRGGIQEELGRASCRKKQLGAALNDQESGKGTLGLCKTHREQIRAWTLEAQRGSHMDLSHGEGPTDASSPRDRGPPPRTFVSKSDYRPPRVTLTFGRRGSA